MKATGIVRRIDALGRTVSVNGEKVQLTPKEIDLLLYMAAHRNIALSRETLLEEVWNYDYFGDDRTVDTHIKMLRRNLGEYRDCIVTVRGMGYKFEA
jgi:DNA-binding response OmpR family regulator